MTKKNLIKKLWEISKKEKSYPWEEVKKRVSWFKLILIWFWKIEVKENIRKFLKKLKNEEINKRFEFVVESFKMNPLPKEKKTYFRCKKWNLLM